VAGGLCLIYAGRLAWRSWRARQWSTVAGQILSADLKRRKHAPAHGGCALRVLYQYKLGPDTYTGGVISPEGAPRYFTEELGRLAIAQQWRPGTTVKVYVNPRNPGDAMLTPRVSFWTLFTLVLGAAMTAAGLWELLSG
jgi:hypothetical protein